LKKGGDKYDRNPCIVVFAFLDVVVEDRIKDIS